MGAALRRLFLSIGVALGLAAGAPDPELVAHLGVEGGACAVDARVENAFAPGSAELIEEGTRLAIRYTARLDAPDAASEAAVGLPLEASETREIWYDMRSGRYGVRFDGGKTSFVVDPGAARGLAASLAGLELRAAPPGGRVTLRAEIGIVDSRGAWHDAPVLWNYMVPRASLPLADAAGGGGP